jgi:hypothetical protein
VRKTVIKIDDALIHERLPRLLSYGKHGRLACYSQKRLDGRCLTLHFRQLDGAAAVAADPENNMKLRRLIAGRQYVARVVIVVAAGAFAAMILANAVDARAGEEFPFDQPLLLDAAPMRPLKRVPMLTVDPNGSTRIDLWCRTVFARMQFSGDAVRVETGQLPEALPPYMMEGQCTPERMQADEQTLAALAQVSEWRRRGDGIEFNGPQPMRFRLSSH